MPDSNTPPSPTEPPSVACALGAASRTDCEGWIQVHVEGPPYERGWQHGWLLADEIRAAIASIRQLIWLDTATPFSWWAANAASMWRERLASDDGGTLGGAGRRIFEELQGIADGVNARLSPGACWTSFDDLLAWNGYPEMICQWLPAVQAGAIKPAVPPPPQMPAPGPDVPAPMLRTFQPHRAIRHHCSSFVATGEWTADSGIVIAHTTWQRFANGDHYNVILSLTPPAGEGQPIIMQTAPGYVASSMDFGQNAAGLVVSSTSINANGFQPDGLPYFARARRAGQYAESIEEWVSLFREGNNGGYANSWLLAEARTGRIAAYELTAQHEALLPPLTSGVYAGCNIPLSDVVRMQDTGGSNYDNILKSGSRRVRFGQLLEQHKGRIDASIAQSIIADHFDVYTRKEMPSGRTICGHFDTDDDRFNSGHGPYYPWGSLDGKVSTAELVGRNATLARWGRACGTPFDAKRFFGANPQYDAMRSLTCDRPTRAWTEFPVRAM